MVENRIVFKDRKASLKNVNLGVSGENEQEVLVFSFEDGFIDGDAVLEVEFPSR